MEADLRQIVARNITYLRTDAGMTQAELAAKINYSDKSVSKWERGEGMPDVTVLMQMAEIFGITVDWILTDHPKPHPPRSRNGMTRNQRIITEIALLGVLYTALLIFAGYWLSAGKVVWIVFVAAVPVGAVVYLVLNTVWGRRRDNVFVISVLIWSLLATVYLGTLEKNMWILFFMGIPAQIVTILAFHIKLPTWKRTGKK